MKIYRYRHNNKASYGILKEERLFPVEGSIFKTFKVGKKGISISEVILLPPTKPTKIVAVAVSEILIDFSSPRFSIQKVGSLSSPNCLPGG